uniref:Uncharacterized protein n=1 Tax=Cacopsylla melanoneura TaxID=428564 RepID=A0A8D8YD87_9HEMI
MNFSSQPSIFINQFHKHKLNKMSLRCVCVLFQPFHFMLKRLTAFVCRLLASFFFQRKQHCIQMNFSILISPSFSKGTFFTFFFSTKIKSTTIFNRTLKALCLFLFSSEQT